MANIELKNADLTVSISLLGAEIQAVTKNGYDYIWNDTEGKFWGRHAPILFPIIGQVNQNSYYVGSDKYTLTQHGFLRDQTFEVVDQQSDAVTLKSVANADTKAKFPFDYQVIVNYRLDHDALNVGFEVTNLNDDPMYYSLGLHPGFNTEGNFDDYALHFEPRQSALTNMEVDPAPLINGQSHQVALTDSQFDLSHAKLDAGLIIFSADGIDRVKLASAQSEHAVELTITDFPYFAIWSPEKKNADFVCVEPFKGLPDVYGEPEQMKDKKAVNTVQAGATDKFGTRIAFS